MVLTFFLLYLRGIFFSFHKLIVLKKKIEIDSILILFIIILYYIILYYIILYYINIISLIIYNIIVNKKYWIIYIIAFE